MGALHCSEQVNMVNRGHTGSDITSFSYITLRDREAKHNLSFLEIGFINSDCGTCAQNFPYYVMYISYMLA